MSNYATIVIAIISLPKVTADINLTFAETENILDLLLPNFIGVLDPVTHSSSIMRNNIPHYRISRSHQVCSIGTGGLSECDILKNYPVYIVFLVLLTVERSDIIVSMECLFQPLCWSSLNTIFSNSMSFEKVLSCIAYWIDNIDSFMVSFCLVADLADEIMYAFGFNIGSMGKNPRWFELSTYPAFILQSVVQID